MKINLEEQENKKILTIEIESEMIDQSFDKALKKAAKNIRLKGFRAGKAPLNLVARSIKPEALTKDVLEEIIPTAYQKALLEKNLEPITEPAFSEIKKIEKGKPFSFKISFETKPQIKLDTYTDLEVTQEKKEITESDIQESLLNIQKRAAKLVVLDQDRGLEKGDYSIADFESYLAGSDKPQKSFKKGLIQIKPDPEYPGLLEQLLGLKAGESKDFSLEIPQDKEGKTKQKITFKITIHEIKKEVLPEINDDLAKQISKFSTLEEFKKDIKKNLESYQEMLAKQSLENKLLDKILEINDIQTNQALIDYETNLLISDLARQVQQQGLTLEDYLKANQINYKQLAEKLKPQAEKAAKIDLAIEAVIGQENLTTTSEELEKEIEKIAQATNQSDDKIKKIIEKEGTVNKLKNNILRNKAVDFVISKAKINYTKT